jgi:hypothetical protein
MTQRQRSDLWISCRVFKSVAFAISVLHVTTGFSQGPADAAPCLGEATRHLSHDSAVIVAEHLTQVLRTLRDGGPPVHLRGEELARWSLDDWLQKHASGTEATSRDEYLDAYRRAFLEQWCDYLDRIVLQDASGKLWISHGISGSSRSFRARGTTDGHFAGGEMARNLQCRVIRESWSVGRQDETGRARPDQPARDALLYIVKEVVGGQRRALGPVEPLILAEPSR